VFSVRFNKDLQNLILKWIGIIYILSGSIYLLYTWIWIEDIWLNLSGVVLLFIFGYSIAPILSFYFSERLISFSSWFRVGTFFSLILESFFLIQSLNQNGRILLFEAVYVDSYIFFKSLLVIVVAFFAFFIVDLAWKPRSFLGFDKFALQIELGKIKINRFLWFSFLILFLNLILNVLNISGYASNISSANGFVSFVKQFIHIFSSLNLCLFSMIYFIFGFGQKNKMYFIVFVLVSLLSAVLSGMKESVISLGLIIAVPYFLAGNKIKLVHILIVLFLLFVFFPFNRSYREALEITNNKVVASALAIEKVMIGIDDDNKGKLASRYFAFSPLMYGVSIENEWNHFKYLNRYIYLPFAWILPGTLLPEKPRNEYGRILYEELRNVRETSVSITPTTFGWAYLEGGYFFVLVVFLIFGVILRFLDNIFDFNSLKGVLLYTVLFSSLIKIEADVYFRIGGFFQLLFCLMLLRIFLGNLRLTLGFREK
jgi:hypothetical protein